jgi:hypothetical protein
MTALRHLMIWGLAALCSISCSVPNLEQPECTAARDTVKRFYSFHFGKGLDGTEEMDQARAAFLTPGLRTELSAPGGSKRDYFTDTEDPPKAFRVGECKAQPDNATLQVVLLWRDDSVSRQEEVKVQTVKTGDAWLIDKVSR